MRDGISFTHDLDQGFPLLGEKMEDSQLSATHPTLLFFGAAGDLNTNRQSKRIVELYKKYKVQQVKFVVIDVDHPATPESKALLKKYYQGYIPSQIVFDKQSSNKWSHSGESEVSAISSQLDKLL